MVVLDSSVLNINLFLPAVQTAAVAALNEIVGKLGDRIVNTKSAAVFTVAATVIASIAKNIFHNEKGYYAGLVASGLAVFAHRYLFREVLFNGISDVKSGSFLLVTIVAAKFAYDNFPVKKDKPTENNGSETGSPVQQLG